MPVAAISFSRPLATTEGAIAPNRGGSACALGAGIENPRARGPGGPRAVRWGASSRGLASWACAGIARAREFID